MTNKKNQSNLTTVVLFALVYSFITAFQILHFNNFRLSFKEYTIFIFYFLFLFTALLLMFFILIKLISFLYWKITRQKYLIKNELILFISVIMFLSLFMNSKWSTVYYNHYNYISSYIGGVLIYILKLLIIIGISLVLAFFINFLSKTIKNLSNTIRISLIFIVCILLFCGGYLFNITIVDKKEVSRNIILNYPTYIPNNKNVILFCADAASPNIINELTAKGELPNIATLIQQGTYGNLKSLPWSVTNRVWPTIATGKFPDKHGFLGFTLFSFLGMEKEFYLPLARGLGAFFTKIADVTPFINYRLPSYYDFSSTPIWEILSHIGYKVGVINWQPSWPVKEVNGRLIARGAYKYIINLNTDKRMQEMARSFFYPYDNFIVNNEWNLESRDRFYIKIAEDMLKDEQYDLFMLGLNINDGPQHSYYKFYKPQYFPYVSKEKIEKYKNKIPDSYKLLDSYVGIILNYLQPDSILIIVSDHGATPVLGDWKVPGGGNHLFNTDGIFIAYGRGIKKSYRVENIGVEDITPTILRIFGLPAAKDMDGRPIDDIFTDKFKKDLKTPAQIKTYDIKRKEKQERLLFPYTKEEVKRLKALGYIN